MVDLDVIAIGCNVKEFFVEVFRQLCLQELWRVVEKNIERAVLNVDIELGERFAERSGNGKNLGALLLDILDTNLSVVAPLKVALELLLLAAAHPTGPFLVLSGWGEGVALALASSLVFGHLGARDDARADSVA